MKHECIKLYENRDDVTLTTYILDDSFQMLNGKKRGCVLICPGGGYLFCSDRESEPVALAFASLGYHAFVLKYSVYSEGNKVPVDPSKPLSVKEHCLFPGPIRDIAQAVQYIRDHADEWRLDETKIALCGFSAGAHNCAMYSVYWDKPEITSHFGRDAEVFQPAACILAYTLSHYELLGKAPGGTSRAMFRASKTALLGTADPPEDMMKRVSPALLVGDNTPPMFLWTTSKDELVPAQQTILMANALAEQGIPFEAHIFEDGPHGLSLATQASASSKNETDSAAANWLPLCAAWLEKRLALDLQE